MATCRAAALSAIFVLGASGAGFAQDGAPCIAARVVGEASLLRGAATQPVRPAMPLRQGDQLVTTAGARVEMRCPDGSTLVVGERSTVRLTIFVTGDRPHNAVVELLEGIVRALLPGGHTWERFDIVTRTAVASVRSTDWIVDAKADTTGVFVEDGNVLVSSRANQAQIYLPAGFGVDVGTQPAPLQARAWAPARVEDARARTRLP
jgi:hypothetical protein